MARTEYSETETVVTVAAFKRLQNTAHGNPRYTLTDDTGRVWRSEPNAMGVAACTLDQYDAPGKRVRLHVNPAGRWTAAAIDTGTVSDALTVTADIGHGRTLVYVHQGAVTGVRVDTEAPRYGATVSGYGGKIPTRYVLRIGGRWRRVYASVYGNSGSTWVTIDGATAHTGAVTEYFLEAARDRGAGEYDAVTVSAWRVTLAEAYRHTPLGDR